MENISFVLWLVLYPIGCSIASCLTAKERKISNKEPHTDNLIGRSAMLNLIVWVIVGILLYN